MKRVKLIVAYDGTNYCGWQVQPNGVSVSSMLNRHLSELLGEEIYVLGASRTDAGVHARGNVAVFDTSARMPAERISYALNTRLPADIRIQDSREVAPDFHPRFRKTRKTYEYKICYRRFPDPINRLYSLFYHWDLDVEKMRQAASYLVGTHDFTSFCTNKPEVKNRVRTIYSLDVLFEPDLTAFPAEPPRDCCAAKNDAGLAENAKSAAGSGPEREVCADGENLSLCIPQSSEREEQGFLPKGEEQPENAERLPKGEEQPENAERLPKGEEQPENGTLLPKGKKQPEKTGGMITVRICGNGFLYNMVRIIVGTLLEVGGGRLAPEEIPVILEAKDRSLAGDTAQAHGLTLMNIEYEEEN